MARQSSRAPPQQLTELIELAGEFHTEAERCRDAAIDALYGKHLRRPGVT